MKRIVTCLLALSLVLGLCGCAAGMAGKSTQLNNPADPQPILYDGTGSPVTAFGLELLAEVGKDGAANPVLSPLSAYLALAMAADGADGETLTQFEQLLHAGSDRDDLCQALIFAMSQPEGSTQLEVAHSVWTKEGAGIRQAYLDQMEQVFAAQVFSADLPSSSARKAINSWVEERTHGLIPKLLEQDLGDRTTMVLLNTLYFKGAWAMEFEPVDTRARTFRNEGGGTASIDFMHQTATMTVAENEDWEGVLLPYDDGDLAFLAVKPKEGELRDLAARLTTTQWQELLDGTEELVSLAMPKLDTESSHTLNGSLMALGLTDAFDANRANFNKMGTGVEGYPLYVEMVLQKVKLTVAEEGTEAAAATAVVMVECSAPIPSQQPRQMVFDSPYLYAVVDLDSGAPLFLGMATEF